MMIKMEKKVDSLAVFTKIILYITIFLIFFKGNIQKMSIDGASHFRVMNNNFLPYFLHEVKIILKFTYKLKF